MGKLSRFRKIICRLAGCPSNAWAEGVDYDYKRCDLRKMNGDEYSINRIKNIINYAKTSLASNRDSEAGYHDVKINETLIPGARNPKERLDILGIDFSDKVVLDVGCNQGGALFSIADKLKYGIGVDFEYKVINVCHAIRQINDIRNINFFSVNLDVDPLENMLDFFSRKSN